MKRFLIFPSLIAVWLISFQFGHMAVGYAITWYTLRIASLATDVYYHTFKESVLTQIIQTFLPATTVGAILGALFAALDFALHRHTRRTKETILLLMRNLLKSGVVAVALILLCRGPQIIIAIQQTHSRYHTYPPDMAWLNLLRNIQILVVLTSVLWAMAKTLKRV